MRMMMARMLVAGALGLSLAACSPEAAEPDAAAPVTNKPMADMVMDAPPAATVAGPIMGVGKVTAVDAAAGTVMLDHEPIPALSWPSMAMMFTASDPALLSNVAVGDEVSFEIRSATESTVITQIRKK